MSWIARPVLLLVSVLFAPVVYGQLPTARQIAAGAADILSGRVRLPEPASTPTVSHCAMLPLQFEHTESSWSASVRFPVEASGRLAFAVLSPSAASVRVFVGANGAALRPIDELFANERRTSFVGDAMPGWVIDRRDVLGAPGGWWSVRVEAEAVSEGWLMVSAGADLRAEAYVTTQQLVVGEPIAIAARCVGGDLRRVESARVALYAQGVEHTAMMFDDGAHEDGRAADGLFGAYVPQDMAGELRARVDFAGTTRAGLPFLRSAPLAFTVLVPVIALDGAARIELVDADRARIEIGALHIGLEQRLHVSAEVWARDAAGVPVPVCWLSRMLDAHVAAERGPLVLELDLRWLDVAATAAPCELRAVRVQDPDTEVVLDFAERIALPELRLAPRAASRSRTVSAAMLAAPVLAAPPELASLPGPALMLVHGYCSSGSIWPAADFSQPKLEFLDPNANRSHDQFAQLLAQHALQANLASFGVVAHSQGGCAALHLRTYYASPLDHSTGARRIQALATPFQGTPLASLGFFACGTNANMTPAGAATWLAGIPSWARAEVFTFTTANSGSACNFFSGLLLADPEDGTVEKARGELPGGNNLGHTLGWCHTTGMSNPASYTDHARNQALDAAAAR